jgi:hypothetical protein
MLHVHVAEVDHREFPEVVRQAAANERLDLAERLLSSLPSDPEWLAELETSRAPSAC